jgi:hypothetical protein
VTRTDSCTDASPSWKTGTDASPSASSASYTIPAPAGPGLRNRSSSAGRCAPRRSVRLRGRQPRARKRLWSDSRSVNAGTASLAPTCPTVLAARARRHGARRRSERRSRSIAPVSLPIANAWATFRENEATLGARTRGQVLQYDIALRSSMTACAESVNSAGARRGDGRVGTHSSLNVAAQDLTPGWAVLLDRRCE